MFHLRTKKGFETVFGKGFNFYDFLDHNYHNQNKTFERFYDLSDD